MFVLCVQSRSYPWPGAWPFRAQCHKQHMIQAIRSKLKQSQNPWGL